jgi:hypothetical protein
MIAVLTLALAIGANAVVFGVLNALILRPMSVPQPQSLYGIQHGSEHFMGGSYPDYLDLRDRNSSFDGLAALSIAPGGLDTGESPASVWVEETSGNYFDVLRLQPYLGRFFHASDEQGANSAPYIVLSYSYWHNHFADDRDVASIYHPRRGATGLPRDSPVWRIRVVRADGEPGANRGTE